MTKPRTHTRQALLNAAEELLVGEGAEALTTRRIAARAGVPGGLVHYHLGTVEALLQALAGRVGVRVVAGQRAAFDAPVPFADRWHAAVLATTDPAWTAWMSLRAMSRTRSSLRATIEPFEREWQSLLAVAVDRAVEEAGVAPAAAPPMAAMASALLHGMAEERLSTGTEGHDAILDWSLGLLLALGEPPDQGTAVRRQCQW
jgi:AcrR family transcriptional regulator